MKNQIVKLNKVKKPKIRTLKRKESLVTHIVKLFQKEIPITETPAEKQKRSAKKKLTNYQKARRIREKQRAKKLKYQNKHHIRKKKIIFWQAENYQQRIHKLLKIFCTAIKDDYNITESAVYTYEENSHRCHFVLGTECCTEEITLLKYFSMPATAILMNPLGLEEAPEFKSRLVTQFMIKGSCYLISLSSVALETFRGATATEIIRRATLLKERISDIH